MPPPPPSKSPSACFSTKRQYLRPSVDAPLGAAGHSSAHSRLRAIVNWFVAMCAPRPTRDAGGGPPNGRSSTPCHRLSVSGRFRVVAYHLKKPATHRAVGRARWPRPPAARARGRHRAAQVLAQPPPQLHQLLAQRRRDAMWQLVVVAARRLGARLRLELRVGKRRPPAGHTPRRERQRRARLLHLLRLRAPRARPPPPPPPPPPTPAAARPPSPTTSRRRRRQRARQVAARNCGALGLGLRAQPLPHRLQRDAARPRLVVRRRRLHPRAHDRRHHLDHLALVGRRGVVTSALGARHAVERAALLHQGDAVAAEARRSAHLRRRQRGQPVGHPLREFGGSLFRAGAPPRAKRPRLPRQRPAGSIAPTVQIQSVNSRTGRNSEPGRRATARPPRRRNA